MNGDVHVCPFCGFEAGNAGGLQSHIRHKHSTRGAPGGDESHELTAQPVDDSNPGKPPGDTQTSEQSSLGDVPGYTLEDILMEVAEQLTVVQQNQARLMEAMQRRGDLQQILGDDRVMNLLGRLVDGLPRMFGGEPEPVAGWMSEEIQDLIRQSYTAQLENMRSFNDAVKRGLIRFEQPQLEEEQKG